MFYIKFLLYANLAVTKPDGMSSNKDGGTVKVTKMAWYSSGLLTFLFSVQVRYAK